MSQVLTTRRIGVLKALAQYCYLCRKQIQRLCFPDHKNGRSTRDHLTKLYRGGFISKTVPMVPFDGASSGCPVYYLTNQGAEALAATEDDAQYLACCTRQPRADHLLHWLAISQTHLQVVQACDQTEGLHLLKWVNEWDVINKTDARNRQYFLHSVFQEHPPLSCSPDAGFLISYQGYQMVVYVEQDRATSGLRQIAASKTPGYHELAERYHHREHFPECNLDFFYVLLVTTSAGRRNRMAETFQGKPGQHRWLFADQKDLQGSFFSEPVFYNIQGVASGLITPPEMAEKSASKSAELSLPEDLVAAKHPV